MKADEVISVMKAGAFLRMQHAEDGYVFWLECPALNVDTDVGLAVIEDPAVTRHSDTLFDDILPQTYSIRR